VAEPELRALLPEGVGLHFIRLPLTGSTEAELLAMLDTLESGMALPADARPDAIGFHCLAVSTFAPCMAVEIRAHMDMVTRAHSGDSTAITFFATADAILAALIAPGTRDVLLVSPYIQEMHQREANYLTASGFHVTGGGCVGVMTNAELDEITPATIFNRVMAEAIDVRAGVCFISCTAVRLASPFEMLEAALGIPVITNNQVLAWYALRQMRISDARPGFGGLFSLPLPMEDAP